MKVTWFSWEWMWHTFSFAERLFLPPRQKSTWNWPIHPWAGTGSLWFSFVLQCNPTCVRGNFGLKLQNSPKNCLAYMLDYIVRQKRKVNREKGYWSTSFPGSLEREDERAWERGWQLLCVVYLVGDWFGSGFTTLKWKPAKSNKFSLKNNRPQHEAWGINPTDSVVIPQSLVLRSIVLGWILIYRNWSLLNGPMAPLALCFVGRFCCTGYFLEIS